MSLRDRANEALETHWARADLETANARITMECEREVATLGLVALKQLLGYDDISLVDVETYQLHSQQLACGRAVFFFNSMNFRVTVDRPEPDTVATKIYLCARDLTWGKWVVLGSPIFNEDDLHDRIVRSIADQAVPVRRVIRDHPLPVLPVFPNLNGHLNGHEGSPKSVNQR